VPSKQPIGRKKLVVVACRVEHHFNDPFDVTIRRVESSYVHSQSSGDGRPHLFCIEFFTFDLAAFEYIGGQSLQYGFLAEVKTQSSHVAKQDINRIICGEYRPYSPQTGNRRGLLSDGVSERMLRCADCNIKGEESWERPKAERSTSSKWL